MRHWIWIACCALAGEAGRGLLDGVASHAWSQGGACTGGSRSASGRLLEMPRS